MSDKLSETAETTVNFQLRKITVYRVRTMTICMYDVRHFNLLRVRTRLLRYSYFQAIGNLKKNDGSVPHLINSPSDSYTPKG